MAHEKDPSLTDSHSAQPRQPLSPNILTRMSVLDTFNLGLLNMALLLQSPDPDERLRGERIKDEIPLDTSSFVYKQTC
jgi:hypothetical protein